MARSFFQRFLAGFRLIDGSELNNALAQPIVSVEDGLTATGTTRADALQLNAAVNVLSTVAAATGVKLKDLSAGASQVIYNDGANPVQVYATDTIDGVDAATGVPLADAKRCQYTRMPGGTWKSAQLGAVSA